MVRVDELRTARIVKLNRPAQPIRNVGHSGGREFCDVRHLIIVTLARASPAIHRNSVIRNFELFRGVLRAKGCFWTAAEPGAVLNATENSNRREY